MNLKRKVIYEEMLSEVCAELGSLNQIALEYD